MVLAAMVVLVGPGGGCRSDTAKEREQGGGPPTQPAATLPAPPTLPRTYPRQLSAQSSPAIVVEFFLHGLDANADEILGGLMARDQAYLAMKEVMALHELRTHLSPDQACHMVLESWKHKYRLFDHAHFEIIDQITPEQGQTATVVVRGWGSSDKKPYLIEVELFREDGVWRVGPDLLIRPESTPYEPTGNLAAEIIVRPVSATAPSTGASAHETQEEEGASGP